jgi:hypothetical protein
MKFKVGDKVRVRTWESLYNEFGRSFDKNALKIRYGFNNDMRKMCGGIYMITSVNNSSEFYTLNKSSWKWTDDMLEAISVHPPVIKTAKLKDIKRDYKFTVAGIEMYKFYANDEGCMCIFANPVFEEAYETCQNYAKSAIHARLVSEVLPKLEEKIGADNLLEFTLNLKHFNNPNKYIDIKTKIGIQTYQMYSKYDDLFCVMLTRRNCVLLATAYDDDKVLRLGSCGLDCASIHDKQNIMPIVCLSDDVEVSYEE